MADYAKKYMRIIGSYGPMPAFRVRDNLGSRWLGRCLYRVATSPSGGRRGTSTVEVQKSVSGDPETLERVIAHEMCHHAEFCAIMDGTRTVLDAKIGGGHGSFFRGCAALVNAATRPGYVTEKSDQEYRQAPNQKRYFVLVQPLGIGVGRFGWSWAVRLSPQSRQEVIHRIRDKEARLYSCTDDRWTSGVKIGRYEGISYPREGDAKIGMLAELYANGRQVVP